MYTIALKMLMGDRAKYLGLVCGVTFATLLMTQQISIFVAIMARTAAAIQSIPLADIWVMDPRIRYIEEVEPMRSIELDRVRSVAGVQWAVPFFKGLATIRMPDGVTQQIQLMGVDAVSLIGHCARQVMGPLSAIRDPSTVVMDIHGYQFTWPNTPLALGKEIEINDHRLIIGGLCRAKQTFFTFPIVYATYRTVLEILPPRRLALPFILVKAAPGVSVADLRARIASATGLQALTRQAFAWRSIQYMLERTGIAINFAITIFLGALIGTAITAQTFSMFILENSKYFAAMKAIGMTNGQLLRMVGMQATFVGVIGYGLGIGATAWFFYSTRELPAFEGFVLHGWVLAGTACAIALIIALSIVFSLRKVFRLDPALIFRG